LRLEEFLRWDSTDLSTEEGRRLEAVQAASI